MSTTTVSLGEALRGATSLLLPARCVGCASPGPPWCPRCHRETRAAPSALRRWGPGPPCWSTTVFGGPVRRAVTAVKDDGRRDAAGVLADLLAEALVRALADDPVLRAAVRADEPVLAVPVPASGAARRRRGGDPVVLLARMAVERVGAQHLVVAPVLHHRRRVTDQSRLGRGARWANRAGSLGVSPPAVAPLAGKPCVLLDDVVTTGATLADAARALRTVGAGHVVAATVAATA